MLLRSVEIASLWTKMGITKKLGIEMYDKISFLETDRCSAVNKSATTLLNIKLTMGPQYCSL
jgi:hypothetical protein